MITYLRVLISLSFAFNLITEGMGQVLRKEHDYLWHGQKTLRGHHWLDAVENISEHVPAADTAYFKSLVYLGQGYRVQARKSIKQHMNHAGHHYQYESRIIQGLAWSNVYYQAFGYFSDAIELNPNRVEAYLEKVKVLADQKDYLVGIDHANEAIRLFPDDPRLRVFRGNLYVFEGLRKRAFKDFKHVIDTEIPIDNYYMAQAHRGIAWAYLGIDNVLQAEIHLLESMVMEPNHPRVGGLLAEVNYLKGNPKGTIEAYETIVGTENKRDYYLMVGLAYEELKQMEEACKFFKACCDRGIVPGCKKVKALNCENQEDSH